MKCLKQRGVKGHLTPLGWSCLLFFLSAGMAWASEGGASKWPDFFYRLLNFSIMVGVLYFIARKPLRQFFAKRTEKIKNTLSELEAKKAEAEKTYQEYTQKLAKLDKETDRILQEYVEQGQREKAKIIANAEKAAAEIREQTELVIQQEIKSAKVGLQKEIAELSVAAAEEMLKERIGEQDQKKLLNDFMTKVVEAK